jgi:ribulose-phosphate 3-epimerase
MIIPALLTTNERIAQERIALAEQMSGWLHIDFLDNSLYPFASLSLEQLSHLDFGTLSLEAHCMTDTPLDLAQSDLPLSRLIVHYELPNWQSDYETLVAQGIDTWVAIGPSTAIENIDLPEDISGIVVMGVVPGQTGQSLLPVTMDRVETIKDYYPDIPLTVDGGITGDTIRDFVALGVDNLVISSALFNQSNPVEAYEKYAALADPVYGKGMRSAEFRSQNG